jgi:hypothetical protein
MADYHWTIVGAFFLVPEIGRMETKVPNRFFHPQELHLQRHRCPGDGLPSVRP